MALLSALVGTTADRTPSVAPDAVGMDEAVELLGSCAWPSEAFWRILELRAVRACAALFEAPVLEIGCGDGQFTQLAGLKVKYGTDLEPRAVSRAQASGAYEETFRLDVHELDAARVGPLATIYANSVLEHVPDLERALPRIASALAPGGRLVATVPLATMNDHLISSRAGYTRWRQHQLQHRNLWTQAAWEQKLAAAGFAEVRWVEYLPAEACRMWDIADVVGALGTGRYRVAPAVHLLATLLMPARAKYEVKRRLGALLLERERVRAAGEPCAAVVIASCTR